jgi:hypothetical protein
MSCLSLSYDAQTRSVGIGLGGTLSSMTINDCGKLHVSVHNDSPMTINGSAHAALTHHLLHQTHAESRRLVRNLVPRRPQVDPSARCRQKRRSQHDDFGKRMEAS